MESGEGLCCPGWLLQLLIALQQDFTQEPVVCKWGCVEAACKNSCIHCSEVLRCMRSHPTLYNGGTGGLPDARSMALYHEHCDFQRQAGTYSGVYARRLPLQPKEGRLRKLKLRLCSTLESAVNQLASYRE